MIEDLSIFDVFIFEGEDRPIWKDKQGRKYVDRFLSI